MKPDDLGRDDLRGLVIVDAASEVDKIVSACEDARIAPRRIGLPRVTRLAIEATTICPLCDSGPDEPCRSVRLKSWHKPCHPHTHRVSAWHEAGMPRGRK